MIRHLAIAALAALALSACSPKPEEKKEITPAADVPAGAYKLDPSHASLIFRVDHLGFSRYTARFKRFEAALQFDPGNPTASGVTATVDARSIETDFPDPAKLDFNAVLQNEQWLDTANYPDIIFRSTAVTLTGSDSADIAGELTLHGVTRPAVLHATFNGGYRGHPMDPNARIGFSAHGMLKRSDFGVAYGIPEPGSKIGVGDEVEILIEAEFSGPPMQAAAAAPAQ